MNLSYKKACSFCPVFLENSNSPEMPCKKPYYPEIAMLERCPVDTLADSAS